MSSVNTGTYNYWIVCPAAIDFNDGRKVLEVDFKLPLYRCDDTNEILYAVLTPDQLDRVNRYRFMTGYDRLYGPQETQYEPGRKATSKEDSSEVAKP